MLCFFDLKSINVALDAIGKTEYTCLACFDRPNVTINKTKMIDHINSRHLDKKLTCPHCYKLFSSNDSLNNHVKRFHPYEDRYSCEKCEYTARVEASLVTHYKRSHRSQHTFEHPEEDEQDDDQSNGAQLDTEWWERYAQVSIIGGKFLL